MTKTCNCEDFPCCGCAGEIGNGIIEELEREAMLERLDAELENDFDEGAEGENAAEELGEGSEDEYLDSAYEDRTEIDFDCGE